ncbi:hypothetical protein NM208_g17130 [Fusarium decemcellulare]|uniref:Uncharacterized protein n=1 Tax=Fusarium decemcellulare TaxID=57161 RepID=A0ACC1R9L1_9HYPO|nr:hypothetical protein NM208_g17130 [Fusarium decemcellulare]
MRPANYLPRPELLLSAFTSISIYGAIAMAQDTKDDNKDSAAAAPAATNTDDKKSDTANTDAAKNTDAKNTDASKPTATAAETAKETNDDKKSDEKTDEKTDDKAAATTEDKPASTTEEKDEPTSTEGDDPTSTEDVESKITSISSANDAVETGLPTLTKLKPIPTYPAATVPPTNNAPFMQHSSAPDGTIFIAVGAILGAFGIAILLWRLIVGILLHRSVERAAKAQHDANAKTGFPAPPAPFYKYTDGNSAMSLSAGRGRI